MTHIALAAGFNSNIRSLILSQIFGLPIYLERHPGRGHVICNILWQTQAAS